jgi:hypothetical protein
MGPRVALTIASVLGFSALAFGVARPPAQLSGQ